MGDHWRQSVQKIAAPKGQIIRVIGIKNLKRKP
jgi:hypothetical protein